MPLRLCPVLPLFAECVCGVVSIQIQRLLFHPWDEGLEPLVRIDLCVKLIVSAQPRARGLHSFTSQLNLSAFYGIRGARRGCVARIKGC
jgi:hypothetical protein